MRKTTRKGSGDCGSRDGSATGLAGGKDLLLGLAEMRIVLENVKLAELGDLRSGENVVPGAVGVLVDLDLLDAKCLETFVGRADSEGLVGESGLESGAELAQRRSTCGKFDFKVDFLAIKIGGSEESENHDVFDVCWYRDFF